jgi:hypothetical protein
LIFFVSMALYNLTEIAYKGDRGSVRQAGATGAATEGSPYKLRHDSGLECVWGDVRMVESPQPLQIQIWSIDRLVFYARNPRKNDAVVDRMCSSIREFGFKIPVLARSDAEVVDGHLRLKAAKKLRITEVPVILCDEWTPAQVKAFRLMVNRSVAWAEWDEEQPAQQ